MPTLVLLMLMSLQAAPQISVEPTGDHAWRMTITATDETDPLRLATRLQPKAEQLCGSLGYHFGRYTFDLAQVVRGPISTGQTSESLPDTLTLIQDVACGPAPASLTDTPPSTAPPALTEADAIALNPELEAATTAWFAALDEARYPEAFAVIDPSMTGGQSEADWTAGQQASAQRKGPVNHRQIGRLTWYSSPPGVPPGYYGAVDYVASRASEDECGYVVWYRPAPGAPLRLTRQETTSLPPDLDAATRATLRQQFCIIL